MNLTSNRLVMYKVNMCFHQCTGRASSRKDLANTSLVQSLITVLKIVRLLHETINQELHHMMKRYNNQDTFFF